MEPIRAKVVRTGGGSFFFAKSLSGEEFFVPLLNRRLLKKGPGGEDLFEKMEDGHQESPARGRVIYIWELEESRPGKLRTARIWILV